MCLTLEEPVPRNKRKSGLSILSIDHAHIDGMLTEPPTNPIEKLLRAQGLDKFDRKDPALPVAVKELLKWHRFEKFGSANRNGTNFFVLMAFSPLLAFAFLQEEVELMIVGMAISAPISIAGFIGMALSNKTQMAKKIDKFRARPFIALVGDTLLENLPERHSLQLEASIIRQEIQQTHEIEKKIDELLEQLRDKRRELGENGEFPLYQEMETEKREQILLRQKATALLGEISQKQAGMEELREQEHNRADLEFLQSKARALTADHAIAFSQRALAELEVNTIDLRHRLHDFHRDLETAALKWKTRNQISAGD